MLGGKSFIGNDTPDKAQTEMSEPYPAIFLEVTMDILYGKIKPMYFKLLVAAAGSSMVASIFGMVDAMMVGRYHGPAGTAALAVFNPMWSFVYSLGILAGIGGSVIFANLRGMEKKDESNEYFTTSVVLGIMLSIVAMVIIALFNEPLFRFFGADDELLRLAKQYLKPVWFAIPCCVFSNIQSAYLRNDGNANLAMGAVLIGGIFNVFGDYFFVFTMDMGITGAGLATAIGLYISNIIMLSHYFTKKNTLYFIKPTSWISNIGKISKNGFSTAISDLSMGIITILFNRQIMKYLGADALSVYGIITQIVAFAQCCAYGAGQAAQPIISQNHGAGKPDRIIKCLKYGLCTCAVFGIIWTSLVEFIPNMFVNFFMTPTEEVLKIAPAIIRVYGLSFMILPFNIFATYYFQAVMQPKISMIASLGRGIVISGLMILILPVIAGADAIWFAMLTTEIIILVFCVFQMIQCNKKSL